MRILIVDDNATNRKLLRVTLEAEGHTSVEAVDGLEALDLLEREQVDAIVSDILMPRMDGYRLCHEIRQRERLRNLPFIVYSSTYTSPEDGRLARDFGADEFVKKPGGTGEILAALLRPGDRPAVRASTTRNALTDLSVMREYSEMLVRKLEQKNSDLERTRDSLVATNQELMKRSEELERTREELRKSNDALESRVRQRTFELEASNKDLEAFSSSVSHDLRAPLRAVGAFASMLEADFAAQLPPEARSLLSRVLTSVGRMEELISGLLRLARLSRQPLLRRAVKISKLTHEVVAELQKEAGSRNIDVIVEDLPDCVGDPSLLRQVVVNLLSNAFKFTREKAKATIEVGYRLQAGENVYYVRDNGAGFDMQYAQRLFGVFQRMHRTEDFEGTGVGLSIVQKIVERHRGRIWAEAEVDKGAVFHFTLPIASEASVEPSSDEWACRV